MIVPSISPLFARRAGGKVSAARVRTRRGRLVRARVSRSALGHMTSIMSNKARFCSQLTGEVLTACRAIPERCVSLRSPPFNEVVGQPQLFLMINQVVQEVSLGTHRFFVLGPGRGTTATHETAMASSNNRKVVHYKIVYANGRQLLGPNAATMAAERVVHAVGSYRNLLRSQPPGATASTTTSVLWRTLQKELRTMLVTQNVSGLFDSPWVNLFSELYLAMCTRDVRVVLSTRDAVSWAKSRHQDHGSSRTGFVCPFAPDQRLLDPFSWPQCAAFARRYQTSAVDANSTGAREAAPKPKQLPGGRAAYDFHDVAESTLGIAMEKYNSYVLRLVPDDLLLEADFFSSKLNEQKPRSTIDPRDEWTRLEMELIKAFTRDSG